MKKQNIFLILLIALLSSCAPKEHMIFNNVPIDGPLDKFVNELTKSGFTISDSSKKSEIVLNGEFLNKNCKIYVWGTNSDNLAYKVMVELPEQVPDSLQYSFEELQKLYSSKYGMGKTRYQQYRNPERFLFNEPGLKRQIRKGDLTAYTTDSGHIIIEVRDGYISITYLVDSLGTDKNNN